MKAKRVYPYDGSDKAGKPYGPAMNIKEIRDHRPIDGCVEKSSIVIFDDDSWEFIWNIVFPD